MTQKEKVMRAFFLAKGMKNIAKRLKQESEDYDVKFPLKYVDELNEDADEFLKLY